MVIDLAVCLNMLIDTDTACVAIVLDLCFTVHVSESDTNEEHNTLQNLKTLMMGDPEMISEFFFCPIRRSVF